MDTVLGLSLTSTTVGWVLAEGHDADGTILDHQELRLRAGHGVRAVSTAEQVADEVLRVDALAAAGDRRLRVIGLTWNDDCSAQAALLIEALTDAGFDNVVPVRLLEAVETLAQAIAPVIGYEQTAVCVLEREWATVVMVDTHGGESQTATKHVRGGFDGLTQWLRGMFERDGWRPGGVVVVGPDSEINGFSWQLEKALPVPVFAQTMAQVTIARGAALAAASSTEFTDDQLVAHAGEPVAATAASSPPRKLSYTGALTALAAGAITFVSAVSIAVGIELAPQSTSAPAKHTVHAPTPQVAEAVVPAVAPPPEATPPAPQSKAPGAETAPQAGAPGDQDGTPAEQQPDPNGRQPYLTRVLEHIPGDAGEGHAPAP